jgi:molecular chaperone GrpE
MNERETSREAAVSAAGGGPDADTEARAAGIPNPEDAVTALEGELRGAQDKYLRLYAEFENFRKKTQRDREEAMRASQESMLFELLPVVDTLELALTHAGEAGGGSVQSLREGVENTVREFLRILGKFGIKAIEALGKPFDPAYHHAMTQVERDDVEDKTVVEEFRKGYLFHDKVLRPSLVAVSRKALSSSES